MLRFSEQGSYVLALGHAFISDFETSEMRKLTGRLKEPHGRVGDSTEALRTLQLRSLSRAFQSFMPLSIPSLIKADHSYSRNQWGWQTVWQITLMPLITRGVGFGNTATERTQ